MTKSLELRVRADWDLPSVFVFPQQSGVYCALVAAGYERSTSVSFYPEYIWDGAVEDRHFFCCVILVI